MNRQSWNSVEQNRTPRAGFVMVTKSVAAAPVCLIGKLHSTMDLFEVPGRADGGGRSG